MNNTLSVRFQALAASILSKEKSYLLALSGGVDSMVLLHLLHENGYQFQAAHCNFQLRGVESDGDQELVEDICVALGVSLHCKRFVVDETESGSTQMIARDLRYAWFETLSAQHDFEGVVLAHHQDDQIETLLLNLIRGAGVAGLAGMKAENAGRVRPLLPFTKEELRAYAAENNLAFREDSSNASDKYKRNRVRQELLPLLESLNPGIRSTLAKEALIFQDTQVVLESAIEQCRSQVQRSHAGQIQIDLGALTAFEPSRFYMHHLLQPYGFTADQAQQVASLTLDQSGQQFFSATHRLVKDRAQVLIEELVEKSKRSYHIEADTTSIEDPFSLQIAVATIEKFKLNPSPQIAALDFDQLQFPLTLRRWESGDRFYPLGMKNAKKVSDFFIDAKVSILEKEQTWLLISGGEIAWILGHRIDDRFKVTSKTRSVYTLTIAS